MRILVKEARRRLKKEGMSIFKVSLRPYGSLNQYISLDVYYAPFSKKDKIILKKVFGELPKYDGESKYAYFDEPDQIRRIEKRFGILPKDFLYKKWKYK